MRQILFEILLVFGGILLTRVLFAGLYKPDSWSGKYLYYVAGFLIAVCFYATWAWKGLDPIQLAICNVLPEVPSCADRRARDLALAGPALPASDTAASTCVAAEHVVSEGEALGSVAQFYGVAPSDIAGINGIPHNAVIGVGRRLFIPGSCG